MSTKLRLENPSGQVETRINGRYRILGSLGRGAQGEVWAVRDELHPDRPSALKTFGSLVPGAIARFEFAEAAKLDHPHLVKVFDLGLVTDVEGQGGPRIGTTFLTEELVDGRPSAIWAEKVPLPERARAVARVGVAVGRALANLHAHGLLHRDVKPGNVLVGAEEKIVKLIDLGLARRAGSGSAARAGTLRYMAPEAVSGFADERSDLFGLGVTLGELLTGERPGRERPLPAAKPAHVPEKLWEVLGRLAAPKPEDRFQTAVEAVLGLGRAMGAAILGDERGAEIIDAASEAEDAVTRAARARSSELVGREAELEAVTGWLERTLAGDAGAPAALLLVGPPGVGKTRMFHAAVIRAELAAQAARRAGPTFVAGSFSEVVRAVAASARGEVGPHLERWLGGVAAEVDAGPRRGGSAHLLREMAELFFGVRASTIALAESGDDPLALDLAGWLHGLRGRERRAPMAFAVEIRDAALFERCRAAGDRLSVVAVAALGIDAETDLMRNALGRSPGPELAKRIHDLTGGVPLLTEAVLAALLSRVAGTGRLDLAALDAVAGAKGPEDIVRTGLLGGLDDAGRALVEAVAVLGGAGAPDEMVAIFGLEDPERIAARLVDLERRGVLTRGFGDELRLPGLVARSLLESLPKKKSVKLHRLAFEALKKRAGADAGDLARLAARAGAGDEARDLALRAAAVRRSAGDLLGAADLLELALAADPAAKMDPARAELARICRQTGRYERALELASAVEQRPGEIGLRAALERAAALRLTGSTEEAGEILRRILSENAPAEVALEARSIAARMALDGGDPAEAARILGDIPAKSDPLLVATGALSAAGLIALALGDGPRAESLFDAGRRAAAEMGELRDEARFLGLLGMVRHGRSEWEAALELFGAALALADKAGDRHGAATYAVNLAAALTELDRAREALDAYKDGIARLAPLGRPAEVAQAAANYALLLLRLGDVEGAAAASQQAVAAGERAGGRAAALAECVRGDVLATRGAFSDARDVLMRAERLAAEASAEDVLVACRQHLVRVELGAGDPRRASEWLAAAADAGAADAGTSEIEQARLAVALAEAGIGDGQAALARLSSALQAGQTKRRMGQLDAYATLARAAAAAGRHAEARFAATAALDIVGRMQRTIPTLHRPLENPLSKEMSALLGRAPLDSELRSRAPVGGWEHLARINMRLNSELRVGRLLENIMDAAVEVTDAERGFLLLVDRKGNLVVRCARNISKESLGPDDQGFSRSVAKRALELGEPVLTTDAQEDERFQSTRSVMDLSLRYVVAVPLKVRGVTTGAVYLDSRRGGQFVEGRLALLTALADQAALALTNARLTTELRHRERQVARLNRDLEQKLTRREGELERVQGELRQRTEELVTRYRYDEMVARSRAMADVFKLLDRVTGSDLPIVVEGESGTGKELVARAVHFNGPRKHKAFVAENCAAIPETLLESVLFGHVKGAFTGAIRDNNGLFAEADGGTLFLDEVGEMPLAMQTKLLRVLNDGEVRPVGGSRTSCVDVRIIVASNTSLVDRVRAGSFREDLFYRLNVVRVKLPPLRQRKEDIPLLADHFARKHGGGRVPTLSREALEALLDYPWPGNVRQLENEIMRALVLADDAIELGHLSEEIVSPASLLSESLADLDLNTQVDRLKRRLISIALKRSGGNQTAAAAMLHLSRFGLQKMMARLGLGTVG